MTRFFPSSLRRFFALLSLICLGVFASGGGEVSAQDKWKTHNSKTGLFSVSMPNKPSETSHSLRLDDQRVLHSSEVVSFVDHRPYREVIKNYSVRIDQSIGPALKTKERTLLINRELDFIENQYKAQGGKVRDRRFDNHAGEYAGFLDLTYQDPELGQQSLRAIVAMSNSNRISQIVSGSNSIMTDEETEKFFDSLRFQKGVVFDEGSLNENWDKFESPSKLFSIKVPPITPPYVTNAPFVQASDRRELVSVVYNDPLWGHQIFYNVYGYRFDDEIGFKEAQSVLAESHIKKHRGTTQGMNIGKSFLDKVPQLTAEYRIKGPKGYGYINTVKLRGLFLGNYMIVQEVMSSDFMVRSSFANNFFQYIDFTPKKAFKHQAKQSLKEGLGSAQ